MTRLFLLIISLILITSCTNTRYLSRHLINRRNSTPEEILQRLIVDLGKSDKKSIIYIDTTINLNKPLYCTNNITLHSINSAALIVNFDGQPIIWVNNERESNRTKVRSSN